MDKNVLCFRVSPKDRFHHDIALMNGATQKKVTKVSCFTDCSTGLQNSLIM